MGPGCVIAIEVTLPETLVVGQKSFFATGWEISENFGEI